MLSRRRDEAVSERANQILDEQAQRRREAAQRGAQTRRQRREQQRPEAQPQAPVGSPTQAPTTRRSRPLAHADILAVAVRGALAVKTRELAGYTGLSLSKLLKDAILVYGGKVDAGYEPGALFADWTARQGESPTGDLGTAVPGEQL